MGIHRLRTRPWSTSCLSYASSIQMTSKLMRKLQSSAHCPAASWTSRHDLRVRVFCRHKYSAAGSHPLRQVPPRRYLAQVRPEPISEVWFTAASPLRTSCSTLHQGIMQTINRQMNDY